MGERGNEWIKRSGSLRGLQGRRERLESLLESRDDGGKDNQSGIAGGRLQGKGGTYERGAPDGREKKVRLH